MGRKIKVLVLAIISIFLFGFVLSRYGPWWGLTKQDSNPSSPSSGIKIFCDTNNSLVVLDPNGSTTELGAGSTSLDDPSEIGTLSLGSGSITDSSASISFGDEALSTTGTFSAEDLASTDDADITDNLTAGDIVIDEAAGVLNFTGTTSATISSTEDLLLNPAIANAVMINADDTKGFIFGDTTVIDSDTNFASSVSSAILTKNGHGLTVSAGMLLYIVDSSTAADEGIYKVNSTTANTIVVDRNLTGAETDVDIVLYDDVLVFMYPTNTGQGPMMKWFSSSNYTEPIRIGGETDSSTNTVTGSDTLYIYGDIEFANTAYFWDSVGAAIVRDNGNFYFGSSYDFSFVWNTSETYDCMFFGVDTTSNNIVINDKVEYNESHDHGNSSNPTVFFQDGSDPDITNNKWGSVTHDGNGFVVATGAETGVGSAPATVDNYIGFHTSSDGLMKTKYYNQSVADDANIVLPSFTNACKGWIIVGNNEERTDFTVDDDGDVTLDGTSGNVVANADTDAKLCMGTAATQEPLVISNRLGGAKNILMEIKYN